MNTDTGTFDRVVPGEKKERFVQIEVGELVLLKGQQCRVVEFGERTVLLRLLSAEERQRAGNRAERRAMLRQLRKAERRRR